MNGPPIIKKHIEALKDYPVKVGVNVNVGSEYTVQEAKDIVEWIFNDDAVDYLQFRPILPRYYKPNERENLEVNDEVWGYLDSLGQHPKLNLSNDKRMDLENNTAFIRGKNTLVGAPVMSTDIRASASLIIAALAAKGETQISRVYHIDRGYENIEQKFEDLGGDIRRISE